MKLFIVSAAAVCYLCLVFGCNTQALRSGGASLTAQGTKTPKDEYKLSADSKKEKAKSLPVTFSHVNHATKNYSIDGTKQIGCTECHHTEQAASEAAKHPTLKTVYPADRTVALTAETAKDAKTPDVVACRACHAQDGEKPKIGGEIPQLTPEGETDPVTLTNEEAYHRNCNGCHDLAVEARKSLKAPTSNDCKSCHTGQ